MIKIRKVSKKYNNRYVLKDIDIEFPRYGIVIIYGPSGCGKTTLLNAISGLLDIEGDIEIDQKNITRMSEKEKDDFRIRNIGFIFQDFKLFESESIENNVVFPLDALTFNKRETKIRKCETLLKLVGLKGKEKQNVNKLSGGEKQRTAIARSLINSPKIILADEPTGALDSKTSYQIMDILSKVATRSLVVIVSHDKELTEKYADQIVEMEDGKVKEIKFLIKHTHEDFLPIEKTFYSQKTPQIPSKFLFRHTLNGLKERKWRTAICNFVTSLGLIGVGLATSLSAAISTNIKDAYSAIIDQSKIIVSLKEDKSIYRQYSGSFYEAYELKEKYPEYIDDLGCCYICDFEYFFKNRNCIAIADTSYYTAIDGISARHINDFQWLDLNYPTIYPSRPTKLEDDEVVLGLTINMIRDICYSLKIERTVTALSNYLMINELRIFFDLANVDWQYDDQQLVTVKGFVLTQEPCIYHYNHMWNEIMFEKNMRFPSNDSLSESDYYPWTMKKVYYFQIKNKVEDFLKFAFSNDDFDPYLLEIANSNYYPQLYKETKISEISRVLFFANTLDIIKPKYFDYFKDIDDELEKPIYGSSGGYSIYPTSLMMGFSKYMYFSSDLNEIEKTIDFNTSVTPDSNQNIVLPDNVKVGHFTQSMNGGVNFEIIDQNKVLGILPPSLNDVVISSTLFYELTGKQELNNDKLHVAVEVEERRLSNGVIRKNFETITINICGIIDSPNMSIYHFSYWPILFFQTKCGVSAYELGINTIAMNLKNEKNNEETIAKLQRAFPNYSISNPMSEINASVDEVCSYIELALTTFSIIAVIISVLILTVCSYLHVLESKKEIGLARCIGLSKKEGKKILYAHSIIMCFISFLMASAELLFLNFFICYVIGNEMGSGFVFTFNPLALVFMLILSLGISLLAAFLMSNKVNKLNPIEALKC